MKQATRYAVLGLLRERPAYPYQLTQLFVQRVGPAWKLHRSTIPQTVKQLAREGLVEQCETRKTAAGTHESVVYAITPAGERAFMRWFAERAGDTGPQRDELMVKVALARDEDLDVLDKLLARYESDCEAEARDYAQLRQTIVAAGDAQRLETVAAIALIDRAASHLECDIEWIRRTRTTISEYQSRG